MPNFIKSNPLRNHPGSVPVHCRHVFSLTQRKHTPPFPVGWVGGGFMSCQRENIDLSNRLAHLLSKRVGVTGVLPESQDPPPQLRKPYPFPDTIETPFQTKVQPYNSCRQTIYSHLPSQLTLVLLNPDIPYLCKQCRARSVGFQLIWIGTVCHSVCQIMYQQSESRNLTG